MIESLVELLELIIREHWIIIIPILVVIGISIYWIIKVLNTTEAEIKNIWKDADANARLIFYGLVIIAFAILIF